MRLGMRLEAVFGSGNVERRRTNAMLQPNLASRLRAGCACLALVLFAPLDGFTQTTAPARHDAAQQAGLQALHLCSGYFGTEAPRALVDATVAVNAPPLSQDPSPSWINEASRSIAIPFADDLPPRIAIARTGAGCTLLPIAATLETAKALLPANLQAPKLDGQNWPLGDQKAIGKLSSPKQVNLEKLLDEAFKDEAGRYGGVTWGVVVIKSGKIVAERYQHGFAPHIAARTNSMCKSLGATLVGIGVRKGLVDLERKAPLLAWRSEGDPRGQITLDHLLRMASGLYSNGAQDPQKEIYRSGAPISEIAALNMMDSPPGKRFVYAGTDSNLAMRAVREAYADDASYPSFPYRELLWKIGMTRTTIETDWKSDFIVSGQCWSTARDFGRLGLLYLSDGRWAGEQILPAGWMRYVSSPAPAQPANPGIGGDARYGAQFWLFGGMDGLPADAFAAFGAMGQYAVIVPSADLVVVRRGFDRASPFQIQKFAAAVVQTTAP